MKNHDVMHLELKRIEVCDLGIALNSLSRAFNQEVSMAEKAGDVDAAQRAKAASRKWSTLRKKIAEQFDAQDKED